MLIYFLKLDSNFFGQFPAALGKKHFEMNCNELFQKNNPPQL